MVAIMGSMHIREAYKILKKLKQQQQQQQTYVQV